MNRTDPKTGALVSGDGALPRRFVDAHAQACRQQLVSQGVQYDAGGVTAEEFLCPRCNGSMLRLCEYDGHITFVFRPSVDMRALADARRELAAAPTPRGAAPESQGPLGAVGAAQKSLFFQETGGRPRY